MLNIYLQIIFGVLAISGILGIIYYAWSRQVDFIENSGYVYYYKNTDQVCVVRERFKDKNYTYIGQL